jgi:hypothetical protein
VRRIRLIALSVLAVFAIPCVLGSCGSDGPTSPTKVIVNPDADKVPEKPDWTDGTRLPPKRSEVITVIKPASDYAPQLLAANCSWTIRGQAYFEEAPTWDNCNGPDMAAYSGRSWSQALPNYTKKFEACNAVANWDPGDRAFPSGGFVLALQPWPQDGAYGQAAFSTPRFRLVKDGVIAAADSVEWQTNRTEYCYSRLSIPFKPDPCIGKAHPKFMYKARGVPVQNLPYVRRDRLWVAQPWPNHEYVMTVTSNDVKLTIAYTHGASVTEIRSFARTLGASASLTTGGYSAGISGSMTSTFGTQTTVTELKETIEEHWLMAVPGQTTKYMQWKLVDRFSFSNADGTPFTDENYSFDPGIKDDLLGTWYQIEVGGYETEDVPYTFGT